MKVLILASLLSVSFSSFASTTDSFLDCEKTKNEPAYVEGIRAVQEYAGEIASVEGASDQQRKMFGLFYTLVEVELLKCERAK